MRREHNKQTKKLPDGYLPAQYIQFPDNSKHGGLDTGVMPQLGLQLNCRVVFQKRTSDPIKLHEVDLSETHIVIYNNDNNEVVCDGVVKGIIPDITVQGLTNKIVLFGGVESSGRVHCSAWRIHYAKFRRKDLNELVGYFVPVLESQGVPCMYDYVSKNTFYNQGTGTFLYA